MKTNKKVVMAMLCYIFCPVAILVLFQNCGSNPNNGSSTFSSLDTGELITPDVDEPEVDMPFHRRVQVNQMVANRILTANYFIDIFGPDIHTTVANNIAYQAADFGSGDSIYDREITNTCATQKNIYSPCTTAVPFRITAPSTIGVNIRREAFRTRTCHTAVKFRTINALKKIDITADLTKIPAVNNVNLRKAFHLFYRARKAPSLEVLEALTIVSQSKTKPIDQWKDILLTLCVSPHWQVL